MLPIRCERCGVVVNEYDVQYIFDEPYCQRCYDEVLPEVERCSACGKEIDGEIYYHIPTFPLCKSCYDDIFNAAVSSLERPDKRRNRPALLGAVIFLRFA